MAISARYLHVVACQEPGAPASGRQEVKEKKKRQPREEIKKEVFPVELQLSCDAEFPGLWLEHGATSHRIVILALSSVDLRVTVKAINHEQGRRS
jgi:hypothetical protein